MAKEYQPTDYEDIDFLPESPYTRAYYDMAKMQGERFVETLLNSLNPEQVNTVLATMTVDIGLYGAILANTPQVGGRLENRKALEHAGDWTLAVVAEAQQVLAEKTGVEIVRGNDMRRLGSSPQNKYRPPKR